MKKLLVDSKYITFTKLPEFKSWLKNKLQHPSTHTVIILKIEGKRIFPKSDLQTLTIKMRR